MTRTTQRLNRLSERLTPKERPPLAVVFHEDGAYWLTRKDSAQECPGPPRREQLTPEQLAALRKTHTIFMVEYAK